MPHFHWKLAKCEPGQHFKMFVWTCSDSLGTVGHRSGISRAECLTSWSSMLLEHLMSVAQPLGWSCREVMQFPRSLSPGISGVKTSRLFLGERPGKAAKAVTLQSTELEVTCGARFYTVTASDLLCEDGSCWSHSPGEEFQLTWTLMCLHLRHHNRVKKHFYLNIWLDLQNNLIDLD